MSPTRVHALPAGFAPVTSSAQDRSSAATTPEQRAHTEVTADTSHGIAFSRSTGLPSRMGKATSDLKTKVPDEVKLAFGQLAHSCGLTESELLRDMVILRLYGREAVLSMQHERMLMVAGSETEKGLA